MVIRDKGEVFLSEIDKNYPDDTDGGYSIAARRLASATKTGHTEIFAICEKNWVDVSALEDAARKAFAFAAVKPNYNLDAAFADARRYQR